MKCMHCNALGVRHLMQLKSKIFEKPDSVYECNTCRKLFMVHVGLPIEPEPNWTYYPYTEEEIGNEIADAKKGK